MASKKSVNTFTKGLNINTTPISQSKDSYSYALNLVKEDSLNNPSLVSNEKGFTAYADLGYPYLLLGHIYLGKESYILFIKDTANTFNRVILLKDTVATTIFDSLDLNFQEKYPIKGTYRVNYKNQTIIYWVDGINEDRILNIDNPATDIDALTIDIKYTPGILSSSVINDDNGGMLTGAYEFYASYKTADNAVTPWFRLTANPIYIIDDNINTSSVTDYISIDGCDSKLPTSKSVTLNLQSLDINFTKLRIGIIKTYNQVQSAYYIDDISYTGDSKSYVYTGLSTEVSATLSDFVVSTVKYYASNAITQSSGRLLRANSKSVKIDIDYQSYANNIVVDYYVEEELATSIPDSTDYNVRSDWWKYAATKYSNKKSLLRDEIYSLGISFGLKKEGIETEVYHIPGRKINAIPSTNYVGQYKDNPIVGYTADWDTSLVSENGENLPKWKVVNTAAKSVGGGINKPAYWESTEMYPTGYKLPSDGSSTTGEGNTPIRHHKMPTSSLEPLFKAVSNGGNIDLYKRHLGLKFSNIQVPDSIKDNISYVRIYMTSRSNQGNKSVVAKGIFTNCSLTKVNGADNSIATSNKFVVPIQPYNDLDDPLNGGTFIDSQSNGWDTQNNYYHSFYSPDTLLRKPVLSSNRVLIENEVSGIVHYYNTLASTINIDPYRKGENARTNSASNGGYKRDIFYNTANGAVLPTGTTSSGAIYNVTDGTDDQARRSTYKSIGIINQIAGINNSKARRKVKQAVYVPFNANLSTDQLGGMDDPYQSTLGPANVLVELDPQYAVLGKTDITDTSVNFTDNNQGNNLNDVTKDKSGTFHFHTIPNPLAVYRYGSLKRDLPSQYGRIEGLEYNPTDLVIASPVLDTTNTLAPIQGLIGDSWIDLMSVKRVRYAAKQNYTFSSLPELSVGVSTFFAESNINHRLRYAGTDTATEDYYPKALLTSEPKRWLDYGEHSQIITSDNFYKENSDFSQQPTQKNYGVSDIDIDTAGIINYDTRIIYSEKLLDESRTDNYRVFLANNYRDLPKNKGFITYLFTKGQELYAITRDSLWRVFASNETIKSTSDTNISVGTGEFMGVDPIELVAIDGGFAGSSSKMSIVETPYGYFFIDRYKGKFILFSEGEHDIAMTGINSYLLDNFSILNLDKSEDFDLPLLDRGYVVGYDAQLKRILVTKLDYKLNISSDYKGVYDPNYNYVAGDIYLRDGQYYKFVSKVIDYVTIEESSDLSSFINTEVEPLTYTNTSPAIGSVHRDDNNNLVYTSTTLGNDSINIGMGCNTTTININVQDAPVLGDYTVSIPSNTTTGSNVVQVQADSQSPVSYAIVDNPSSTYTINSTTGNITVNDSTYLPAQTVVTVKATNGNNISDTGKVTINVTPYVDSPVGIDKTVTIPQSTIPGSIITTIDPATWAHPSSDNTLIYSTISVPSIFTTDFNAMSISLNGTLTDPSYDLVYKVTANSDSTKTDNFTVTINVQGTTTYSSTRTQDFQKNDCASGSNGSTVTYSKSYTSNISQQDADNIAASDSNFVTEGQANANTNGSCTVLPSDAVGILVVDIYDNGSINPVGFVNTAGTVPYNQQVSSVNNFYPNDGTSAAQCWELASDIISNNGSLRWRFEFNIARLLTTYPGLGNFQFIVKDTASSGILVSGAYSLKGADAGYMVMQGSEGSYIPSTSGATNIGLTNYNNKDVSAGLVFNYDVPSKTLSLQ